MKIVPTVLVTGAGGFLGALVAEEFERRGWKVFRYGRSNRAPRHGQEFVSTSLPSDHLVDTVEREKPAVCVHCAGTADPRGSLVDPGQDFTNGPQLTMWLLDVLRQHSKGSRLVFLSSAAVYGNPTISPIPELAPKRPMSPYGYHKLACELVLESFRNIFGVSTVALRIFSAYGPGLRRQVVWDLLNKIAAAHVVEVQGTGAESRDFIFGEDVARAAFHVGTLAQPDPVYNLATGVETTITELVQALLRSMQVERDVRFAGASVPGLPLNWRADISRLRATGWHPTVDLAEGLRRTIASLGEREE